MGSKYAMIWVILLKCVVCPTVASPMNYIISVAVKLISNVRKYVSCGKNIRLLYIKYYLNILSKGICLLVTTPTQKLV